MRKSQISVIELPFMFLLLGFILFYFYSSIDFNETSHKLEIESFLDSIYYSENFRTQIFQEDLSSLIVTSNWSNFSQIASSSFLNYELIISNNTVSKKIFSCNSTYNKYYAENILSIENNNNFEFRKIMFGVCY